MTEVGSLSSNYQSENMDRRLKSRIETRQRGNVTAELSLPSAVTRPIIELF